MKIYESAEDYLEKILMLTERNGDVRSIDIATEMGVTKPSVSIAMKNLRQAGYISMDGSGYITLEPPGLEIATRIYSRHKTLTRFFVALGAHNGGKHQTAARQLAGAQRLAQEQPARQGAEDALHTHGQAGDGGVQVPLAHDLQRIAHAAGQNAAVQDGHPRPPDLGQGGLL